MNARKKKQLYKQAFKEVGQESHLIQLSTGQQIWQGHRRRYKELKKQYKTGG